MSLTNENVVNFFELGLENAVQEIKSRMQEKLSYGTVEHSVTSLIKTYRQFKKSAHRLSGKEKLENFLQAPYNFPKSKQTCKESPQIPKLKADLTEAVTYKKVAIDLASELHTSNHHLQKMQEKLVHAEKKLKDVKSENKNILKDTSNISRQQEKVKMERQCFETEKSKLKMKLKEKEAQHKEEMKSKNEKTKEIKQTLRTVQKENLHLIALKESQESKLKRKSLELKAANSRESYQRTKVAKLEEAQTHEAQSKQTNLNQFNDMLIEIDKLKTEIKNLKTENSDLRNQLLEHQLDNTVTVFDEDKKVFLPELQTCVYELLSNHVSSSRVSKVIEAVLKLAGKKANHLPSTTTVQKMNLQRLVLSQKQLGDLVNEKHISLYTDETSKYGNKVMGFHIRDNEGHFYTLGLRDLVTKSGKDSLQTFKEILNDIDKTANDTESKISKQILTNITSTMSDSASTEKKFNELLKDYRLSVLPYTIQNYDHLDEESKKSVGTLMNFFCGMHSLVHIAEVSATSLLKVETELFEPQNPPISDPAFLKANESGCTRLIRTACKAFARGADEKSGCHLPFLIFAGQFLKEKNMKTLKLTPFRGNRFNILFFNAGQVFFLRETMTDFLKGHELNRLTRSVLHDLETPIYVAGCKALGLISKLVTTPLWDLLEDKTIHVLEMCRYYLMLKNGLMDAAKNLGEFLTGKLRPFQEAVKVKEDCVYDSLVESSEEYDHYCISILAVILPALAQYVTKKFADYLPGGKFTGLTQVDRDKTNSVEKHNKFSEYVFAYYDQLLRFKPNIQTLASEAYVMFSVNRTSDWLNQKSPEDLENLLCHARKNVSSIQKQFKVRKDEIKRKQMMIIQEERRKKEIAEAKRLKEKEITTDEIIYYGLWQSVQQVDEYLQSFDKDSEKVDALKAQLRFRNNILLQRNGDPKAFTFSKVVNGTRVQLPWEELAEKVKVLVQHAFTLPIRQGDDVLLVGKRVCHTFKSDDDTNIIYNGKVLSRVSSSKNSLIFF